MLCLCLLGPLIASADRLPDISDGEQLPGKSIRFDLITPDDSRARDFYRAGFGWEFELVSDQRARYNLIRHDDRVPGGIFQPATTGSAAAWLTAMSVDDIDDAASYALANGAEIVLSKRDFPDLGQQVLLRAPQGALIALPQTRGAHPGRMR